MGVSRIQATQYGDAYDSFVRAHRLEPERPEALVNFGYLADMRGDWKRAVSFYVQAIAVDPYVPESYVNLGIDYEHNDLYDLGAGGIAQRRRGGAVGRARSISIGSCLRSAGTKDAGARAAQSRSGIARSRRRRDR